MKGAADAAHGTKDGTLPGARSSVDRAESMSADTSRFAEAGLRARAADRAEAGMAEASMEAMDSVGMEASGADSDGSSGPGSGLAVASGCSTPERSGW